MSYYTVTIQEVKELIKAKECKNIRLIIDEQHLTFKTAKTAIKELLACVGNPEIYRNMNKELTFNFDGKGE